MLLKLQNTTSVLFLYCMIIDEMAYLVPVFSHFKHEWLVPGDGEYIHSIPWLLKPIDRNQNYASMMNTIGYIDKIRFSSAIFKDGRHDQKNKKQRGQHAFPISTYTKEIIYHCCQLLLRNIPPDQKITLDFPDYDACG